MKSRFLFLYTLLFFISASSNAGVVDSLREQAIQQQLWLEREWLNLIHYDVDAENFKYSSQVDDRSFFAAEDGATNPEAELLQTLTALFDDKETGNRHARCRYPARLNWLQRRLDFDIDALPAADCADYREWRKAVRSKSVTMVFPAYHLNSPSSMFGHTLLRLDNHRPDDIDQGSDWLSFAVNFGANVNEDDNSLFYAFKGLSGGYPGIFITTPYFNKIREYNRDENRDIWEYQLNLTAAETEKLVLHLWELKEINFDYYFFDENCSYRLLELLEVARPSVELTDEFILTAIPVDTVRAIQKADMVSEISYRPSKVTTLQHLIDQIPDEQHQLIIDLSEDADILDSEAFLSLDQKQRYDVTYAAYQYFRYQQRDIPKEQQSLTSNYRLLQALNSYNDERGKSTEPPAPVAPDLSHLSKQFTAGVGRRNDKNFLQLEYKFSFHDLEDNLDGFLPGAEINIGELELHIDDEEINLYRLDFVDIFSITPRNRFFDPLSWRIRFGLEQQFTGGRDKLATHVTGGAGVTMALDRHYLYGLLLARLEHNSGFEDTIEIAAGFHTGLLSHYDHGTGHLELSGYEFSNNVYRIIASYTHNIPLAQNHSINLQLSKEWQNVIDFEAARISYQYYF